MVLAGASPQLPPGFRFHPTDEELLIHYLRKRAASVPLPVPIIADIDLYKFDPWELPGMASFGEHEWYFFSQRDRKYPNGARPNRAATSGYWKATGTDKPVMTSSSSSQQQQQLGVKKALVFYGGKPPKGIKTNWIMHEYRLLAHHPNPNPNPTRKPNSSTFHPSNNNNNNKAAASPLSLRLDDWVLCRIYHKNNSPCSRLMLPDNNNVRDDHDDYVVNTLHPPPPVGLGLSSAPSSSSTGGDDVVLLHNYLFEGGSWQFTRLEQFPTSGGLNYTTELAVPMKRTFPFLYWSPAVKRFNNNNNNKMNTGGEELDETSTAITLLKHQQQQQQVNNNNNNHHQEAILGDGVLSHPAFQLPGVNW